YDCPHCGGEMGYDAASQMMLCSHCSSTIAIPASDGHSAVVEYDLEHGLAMSRARGYGVDVRTTQCRECGAHVSFPGGATTRACEFCGSSHVMEQSHNRNALRPESLVPFRVSRSAATRAFASWLRSLWFRPSTLRHQARAAEIRGAHVPYWT